MSRPIEPQDRATLSGALGFSETVVDLGMTHPGLRRVLAGAGGTIGFLVSLDDDRITDLEVEIGFGHRGFEKEIESRPWPAALPYVGRLGLAGGLIAEVGYALAVERLAGIAVPDRAIWLRMLVSELARVADHWARLAALAAAIEIPDAESLAHVGEGEAARLIERATGRRPLVGWIRVGGVASALPEGFGDSWPAARQGIEALLDDFDRMAVDNPSCQARLRGVAPLSADACLAWGVTGPCLRAAGLAMDVRRDAPYLAYGAVDFDVPIGENGDDFDRVLVVVEEIRQSLRIVDQCVGLLASLGPGALATEHPAWQLAGLFDGSGAPGSDAGLERPVGPVIEAGSVALSVEAPTGELGFLLVSDGGPLPRRSRCRAPSFLHAQALPAMLRGSHLDDLLPTAALMHLVSAECDR